MTTAAAQLLEARIKEIVGEDRAESFICSPHGEAAIEAVERGWPFMITKQPHGGYDVYVQKINPATPST